jgi:hypothetical protein
MQGVIATLKFKLGTLLMQILQNIFLAIPCCEESRGPSKMRSHLEQLWILFDDFFDQFLVALFYSQEKMLLYLLLC